MSRRSDNGLPVPAVAFSAPTSRSVLRVRWAKLKRRIGNGSAPDESLGEPTTDNTTSDSGSNFGGPGKWGAGGNVNSRNLNGEKDEEVEDEVDEIVVENMDNPEHWGPKRIPGSSQGKDGTSGTNPGTGITPGRSGQQSDGSSLRHTAYESTNPAMIIANFLRWRVWPIIW